MTLTASAGAVATTIRSRERERERERERGDYGCDSWNPPWRLLAICLTPHSRRRRRFRQVAGTAGRVLRHSSATATRSEGESGGRRDRHGSFLLTLSPICCRFCAMRGCSCVAGHARRSAGHHRRPGLGTDSVAPTRSGPVRTMGTNARHYACYNNISCNINSDAEHGAYYEPNGTHNSDHPSRAAQEHG